MYTNKQYVSELFKLQQLHLTQNLNYSDGNMFLRTDANDDLLVFNRTHTTYGTMPFAVLCYFLWNKVPKTLCTSHSLATFE